LSSTADIAVAGGELAGQQVRILSGALLGHRAFCFQCGFGGLLAGGTAGSQTTRQQLGRLLEEMPAAWRPFFDLLASTGLRIGDRAARQRRPPRC
jgi:hypothetical protein